MRPSYLLTALILLMSAYRTAAQTPPPTPQEVIRLAGGSSLVGSVTSTGEGKIRMHVEGLGDVLIDSARVASRSPLPSPSPPPSPWSGKIIGSVTQVSEVVPGVAGSTLGAQVTLAVDRTDARNTLTLEGSLLYVRVRPSAATANQWGLTLGDRWVFAPRWALMGRSMFEVNHVQYLEYRSVTIAGLGFFVVKSNFFSLLLAPGFGYGKSEQTPLGRVLSFGAGIPPSVEGPITGVHDLMTLQLTPTLSLQQDLHYFWSLRRPPYRQAQLNARLLGMMTRVFGLSVAFKGEYDTSMPPPVNRTWWSLIWGVQLNF